MGKPVRGLTLNLSPRFAIPITNLWQFSASRIFLSICHKSRSWIWVAQILVHWYASILSLTDSISTCSMPRLSSQILPIVLCSPVGFIRDEACFLEGSVSRLVIRRRSKADPGETFRQKQSIEALHQGLANSLFLVPRIYTDNHQGSRWRSTYFFGTGDPPLESLDEFRQNRANETKSFGQHGGPVLQYGKQHRWCPRDVTQGEGSLKRRPIPDPTYPSYQSAVFDRNDRNTGAMTSQYTV